MAERGHVGWSPDFKSTGAARIDAERLRVIPPNVEPGGLFPPVPTTPAQERQAFLNFLGALASGAKHDPERLWALLGYSVTDCYLSDADAAERCAEVTALLRDVHEAIGGPVFETPPPFSVEDADDEDDA